MVQIGHRGPFLAVILFQLHVLCKTLERVLFAIFREKKRRMQQDLKEFKDPWTQALLSKFLSLP